ncbi:DUF5305 domain-containing protein [Halapricum salinum]|uniref:DUF5305 domain-containing protein n=1 Tax=Halapricum salinum TaxID=1457250 RepID=A0A4D6HB27_9EURY|nr:DUF5305 domain-containing protein [Halapricum salinum]QCC49967.1 hypothetical protein DV733_01445 [Halapricum salinum]
MDDGGLRVRAVADENVAVVVVVLVALVGLGVFMTYGAYGQTNERTETTVDTEVTWTSTGQFAHQATVINDTRVFDVGETLENRSAYFRKIAPRLNGSFVYNYTSDSGELTAEASTTLVVRSVADGGQVTQRDYWRIERPLEKTTATLAPGETLRQSFAQNVSRLEREIEQIQTELGTSAGTIETTFVTRVQLDGTRSGQPVETNRTYRLPLTIENDLYRVNDSGPVVERGERTVRDREEVMVPPGPLWRYGGPLALFVGVVGLIGLGYGRYSGLLLVTEREHAYLDYRADRAEFDEWISEARFPAGRVEDADTSIETTSLSGLVDLAIDTDRRVIEVADDESYLVLDGDVVYYYDAPTLSAADDLLEPSDAVASLTDSETDAERASEQARDDEATQEADADGDAQSVFERLRHRADLGSDGASTSDESANDNETVESNSGQSDVDETHSHEKDVGRAGEDDSDADAAGADDDSESDAEET